MAIGPISLAKEPISLANELISLANGLISFANELISLRFVADRCLSGRGAAEGSGTHKRQYPQRLLRFHSGSRRNPLLLQRERVHPSLDVSKIQPLALDLENAGGVD